MASNSGMHHFGEDKDQLMLYVDLDVNPYKLPMNCYYCTLAALHNMTVSQLVDKTEIMQNQGTSVANFKALCTAARMSVPKHYEFSSVDQVKSFVRNGLRKGQTVAVPLAWDSSNSNNGHMVVLQATLSFEGNLRILVYDFQRPLNDKERVTETIPSAPRYYLFDTTHK